MNRIVNINKRMENPLGVGDVILISGATYAILGHVAPDYVQAISLKDGNRWTNPTKVNDPYILTNADMSNICAGSTWKLINSVTIKKES